MNWRGLPALWTFALSAPRRPQPRIFLNFIGSNGGEFGGEGMHVPILAVAAFVTGCLRFGPGAIRYETYPFLEGDEPIGENLLEGFVQSIWPIHVDVDRSGAPQTEVQAGIVA